MPKGGVSTSNVAEEELNSVLQECSENVQELISRLRERGEGVEEDVMALADKFAAIDAVKTAAPLLKDVAHHYRELKAAEKDYSESIGERNRYLDTLQTSHAAPSSRSGTTEQEDGKNTGQTSLCVYS